MKRRAIILFTLLLVATLVFAACGGGGGAEAPAAEDSGAADAAEPAEEAAEESTEGASVKAMLDDTLNEADEAAINYCQEQTGVTVEWLAGPDSATDRLALYLQFFGAGSGDVDLLQIDVIWPGILAEHLVDLGPALAESAYVEGGTDAYFQRIVENNTVDGALVGIPWFTDAGLLYYRTDLLEKYGFDGPPTTWAELEEMATTIQEGERSEGNSDFWGYVWQGAAYEGLTCDALEWQVSNGGGQIVESDGTITINNPQAASAFDMAAAWVGNISPPGVTSYMEEDARGVWQAGNAAFMRNWPYAYSLGNAEGSSIAGQFDVGLLPMGEGSDARHAATLGGWQMAVSRYSENIDAATEMALCLAGSEAQKIRAIQGSRLPTIGDLYQDAEVLEASPFFGSLFDVFAEGSLARPSTVTGEDYNQVSTIYFTEVNEVLTGQQSGEEAVASIEEQLSGLLQ
jgi:trehalose/maltose transport system substrate-binding protein